MQDRAEELQDRPLLLKDGIIALTSRISRLQEGDVLRLKMGHHACLTLDVNNTSNLVFEFNINTSPGQLKTIISALPAGCIFTPDYNIPVAFLQVACPALSFGTFFRPCPQTPIINIELVQQILPPGCQYMSILNPSVVRPHTFFSNPTDTASTLLEESETEAESEAEVESGAARALSFAGSKDL